jgi:hypothetical protein
MILFMIVVIVVLALLVYAIQLAPLQAPFKNIIIILCIVFAALLIASKAGLL